LPNYRIDLSYVGTDFNGWQSQADGSGIQDTVEKALAVILRHPVRLTGSARTDSGVHAEHQVATFNSETAFDAGLWRKGLQAILPKSIGIMQVAEADPDFNPIRASTGKAYCYRIWTGGYRDPFYLPVSWWIPVSVDVNVMKEHAKDFLGRHDYSAFCAANSSALTRERTIFGFEIIQRGPLLEIWVLGDGFLKQMVRSMVGTLVDIASQRSLGANTVTAILASCDRRMAGQTAPASGLTLVNIFYGPVPSVSELLADRWRAPKKQILPFT